MSYDLIGIGNALVDIEVQVDDVFIENAAVTKGGMTLSSIEDQNKILVSLQSKPKKFPLGVLRQTPCMAPVFWEQNLIIWGVSLMIRMDSIIQKI